MNSTLYAISSCPKTVKVSHQEMTISVRLLIHEQFGVSLSDKCKLRNEFLLLWFQHFRNSSMNKYKFALCVNNEKKKKIFLKPNKLSVLTNVSVMG